MNIDFELLKQECSVLKADRVAVIDVEKIVFRQELRDMCKSNVCGKYGTNWACPPGIGELEEVKIRAEEYAKALVIQTVYQLEDSFDFEGMLESKKEHKKVLEKIFNRIKEIYPEIDKMALSAGGCEYCEKCTYLENQPCRFPDQLIAPIEGYGIDVTALANTSGIPYNNGPNTVSYMSAVLFK
ncbi:DUF2284 domain-containing protein [Cellulosilyticum sp. I15G10I2]|uniref:DUF2284 domain-containing protein n=1 Tax=Cellulosilyticum sp. I15G10I2 TaxID=1892843 RepID=UPI00085C91B1|nr:DUF2284 domain-containing protein [Cellulosilyticum sp. I15G10I2]